MYRDKGFVRCDSYYHRENKIYLECELYYFKYVSNISNIYNELIAEEIAKEFGVKNAVTDIGTIDNNIVILSKDFVKNKKFIKMEDILKEVYQVSDTDLYNNIEDVSYALKKKYGKDFKDDITKMFLFDVLIGNGDRHSQNYGVLETDKTVRLAPIYDNEEMLGSDYLFENIYSFGVNRQDYYASSLGTYHIFEKFLDSNDDYTFFINKRKEIINRDNVEKILTNVEKRLDGNRIPSRLRKNIEERFDFNYKTISRIINERKQIKKLAKK
jgi:hypothetical protein